MVAQLNIQTNEEHPYNCMVLFNIQEEHRFQQGCFYDDNHMPREYF